MTTAQSETLHTAILLLGAAVVLGCNVIRLTVRDRKKLTTFRLWWKDMNGFMIIIGLFIIMGCIFLWLSNVSSKVALYRAAFFVYTNPAF